MILLALVAAAGRRLTFRDELVSWMGGMLGVFIAVEAFLVFAEMLTAAYPGASFEADPVVRLVTGSYAPVLLVRGRRGAGDPVRDARRRAGSGSDVRWVAVASVLGGRGDLRPPHEHHPGRPHERDRSVPPGVSIGTPQPPGTTSFSMSLFYVPSWVEWLVTIGVLSLGGLVFTVAVLILPLREKAAGGEPARS